MNELRDNILKVINDISVEKGYSAIFTQNALMMVKPELDVTELVVSKLNDKIKAIKVDWKAASTFPKADSK